MPRSQSAAVSSASRVHRLTGKPVTESDLSIRAPAQRAADMIGNLVGWMTA